MQHSPSWEANRFEASQEIPTFYGTRRFITAITSARQLSLSSAETKSYRFFWVTVSKQPFNNALNTSGISFSRDFNSNFSLLKFCADFLLRCSKYCIYSSCLHILCCLWKSGLNRFWFKEHNFTWCIQIFGTWIQNTLQILPPINDVCYLT